MKFVASSEIPYPIFIICPAYSVAYNTTRLQHIGIESANEYRKGRWIGIDNSIMDERSIFDYVTHDVDSILEKIEIRFDYRKQNKMFSENNLKNLTYVEKYDVTYGRCSGIVINGNGVGGIFKTVIIAKIPLYVFVQQNGQFSENGKSRLENVCSSN